MDNPPVRLVDEIEKEKPPEPKTSHLSKEDSLEFQAAQLAHENAVLKAQMVGMKVQALAEKLDRKYDVGAGGGFEPDAEVGLFKIVRAPK